MQVKLKISYPRQRRTAYLIKVGDRDYVIVLAIEGKHSSEQFAKELEQVTLRGSFRYYFIIGARIPTVKRELID